MKDIPNHIYLQWHGDENPNEDGTFDPADIEPGDVSWCCERIFESDTMFVRADLFDTVTAERDTAKEIIKELVSAAQRLAASRTYNPEILRDLLARAKELLK